MKMAIVATLALAAGQAFAVPVVDAAQPTYSQARGFLQAMSGVVADTGLWHKKPLPQRIDVLRKAEALQAAVNRAFGDNVFGPFGQCVKAAIGLKFYVINLNDLALLSEGRSATTPSTLYAPPFQAFQFGQDYAECAQQIEALDDSNPQARAGKPNRR